MSEIKDRLNAINNKNIDLLLLIGLICALFIRLFSLLWGDTNLWSPRFFIYTGLVSLVILLWLLRRLISFKIKLYTLIAALFGYFSIGLFNRSLLATSSTFLVFGPFMFSFLLKYQTTIRLVFLLLAVFAIIGTYTILTGAPILDAEYIFHNRWSWVSDTIIMFAAALGFIILHQRNLSELREIHDNLEHQNIKLSQNASEITAHQAELEKQVKIRSNELRKVNTELSGSNLRVAEKNLEIAWQNEEMEKHVEEIRRVEQELIETDKLASIGIFANGISQNIILPLAVINEEYEKIKKLIETEPAASREKLEQLSGILVSGMDRINRIINDLGHLSHSDPNETCELNALARSASLTVPMLLSSTNIKLVLPPASFLARIYGNHTRLERILTNLLTNACHALEHTQHAEIKITIENQADWLVLSVEDNGPGISRENLNRVKDPFFTTKEPGRGTGLGLFLCQSLMQDIGGKLEIESEVGKGTRVMLFFQQLESPDKKTVES